MDAIQSSLNAFSAGDLTQNALSFFAALGYVSERQQPLEDKTYTGFAAYLNDEISFSKKNALVSDWRYVDFLFQLTESELSDQQVMFTGKGIDDRITSYLFFVIELSGESYSRTALSQIIREVNKVFPIPVMILFKYGAQVTLAIIDRQPNKRDDSKDVLRKVTLIKDIRWRNTHRAHLEILNDLALANLSAKNDLADFLTLHQSWQKVLDTKELNKRFFKELANWYFWAVDNVTFPADEEKDDSARNATSVIRLITRLMFVWFLKEKGVVTDKLFEAAQIKKLLRGKDKSAYYKAILQNLFFATLNSTMGERKFIAESSGGRNSQHFVHNVFRYKNEFLRPEETIKDLFEPIPFLNGGLFECLDKEVEKDNGQSERVRVDGFSDNPKNVLRVPDELFFGAEHEIDLNEIYGTKNKKYKVRGLINLLNGYKFTIAENTPIEEEIALDPELLGKVFENLLANYNPETRTTARKQTGSFYTPREIVNYMVDESLIAYLKTKLQTETVGFQAFTETQPNFFGNEMRRQQAFELPVSDNRWQGQDEALDTALRDLLAYNQTAHQFTPTETEILIKAIDNCKILDPACGSGAFPMGVLLKLVHILEKLDPDNAKWREWQKLKAIEETKTVYDIGNKQERESRLREINEIFEDNSSDYGRKLFLIENCIYGVDIQPIAIQIAKLRFFISLIVDQDFNDDPLTNRGIRPLPNLETKFVAANTLIGLEMSGLKPDGMGDLEKELKEIRAKHFGARTRKTKEKYRLEDKRIRTEIAALLKRADFPETSADQIANWNPYDQNAKADWFDAEWMFGIEGGFDIVIGNPPYGGSITSREADFFKRTYKLKTSETAILFIERGRGVVKKAGLLSYIVPKSYSFASNYKATREFTLNEIALIVDCGKAFENVLLEAMVFQLRIGSASGDYSSVIFDELGFQEISRVQKSLVRKFDFLLNGITSEEIKIGLKMISSGKFLDDIANNNRGQMLQRFVKSKGELPVIGGKEINRFGIRANKGFIDRKTVHVDKGQIEKKSLLAQNIIAHITQPFDHIKIIACIPTERHYVITDTINQLSIFDTNYSQELVWGLLNSKLVNWYAYRFIFGKAIRTMHFDSPVTSRLPIRNATEAQQSAITILVGKILAAKKSDTNADTKDWEAQIDSLVYQLYGLTNEEIALVEGAIPNGTGERR